MRNVVGMYFEEMRVDPSRQCGVGSVLLHSKPEELGAEISTFGLLQEAYKIERGQ